MSKGDAPKNDSTEPSPDSVTNRFGNESGTQHNATGKSMQFIGAQFLAPAYFSSPKEENWDKRSKESESQIRRNLRDWLIGNRSDKRYHDSIHIRHTGTCDWIFEDDKFKSWRSLSSSPKLFWIKGSPGFGKTVLCARIIERITRSEETVAHYFFSSNVESQKDPMVAMRSWIYHMSLKNISLAHIVNEKRESGPPSQPVIVELFQEAMKMVPNCTLVIDGLDECAPDNSCLSVTDFMKKVNEAVRETNTRILVMSRPETEIGEALKEVTSASFSEHAVNKVDVRSDIEALSKVIVAEKLRDKDETIQAKMADKMSERSEGKFLWLRLQRDSLSEGLSREELQKAIEEMPADISELYSRSWKTISQGTDRARVVLLLRLVVFSFRHLTIRELCEAILVSNEFCDFPVHDLLAQLDEKTFKEKILDLCGSFLGTRKPRPESPIEEWTIHPVHFTVKEYYLNAIIKQNSVINQSDSLWIAEEHGSLAELCIKYMNNSYGMRDFISDVVSSSKSFTQYAAKFWNQHAEAGTDQRKILIERFFDENTMSWSVWMKWFHFANDDWANDKSDRDPAIPLCYAIELGYVDLAKTIIKKGVYRVNYSSNSRTALGVACSKGYEDLARELLARGAKIGIRDVHGRTAVYYAAMNGHPELVKLLIDNGADINTRDYNGESPFLAASANGHLSIMRQLIQKGADIHLLDKDGKDALFKASSNGHLNAARVLIMKGAHRQLSSYMDPPIFVALKGSSSDLARLLIKKEVDLNIQVGIKKRTILHVAIFEGKTDIAKLLIEDPKVNRTLQDADGQTPLFVACLQGRTDIAKLLIEDPKVNLTMQDADGQTPLFVACLRGRVDIVKLLIEKGVDVKTPDKDEKTPLYAACANRHLEIATLLIERGADAKSPDKMKLAPLSGAILGGSFEVVEKLTKCIEKAADVSVNVRNDAILAASQKGNVELLQLLIHWIGDEIKKMDYAWPIKESPEKVSEQCSQQSSKKNSEKKPENCNILDTALLLASGMGHDRVVELLLKNDANRNYSDPCGQTPLYAACCNGHLEVARLLIERGANVKVTEEKGQTPLMAACANGCLDLVKLLLEKGADIAAVNSGEMGAAFAAAQGGYLEVLKLLISKGADIFSKSKEGLLPIHAASQNGHDKVVECLIDSGSDVTAANNDKRAPLWLASSTNRIDVVNVLLQHGVDVDAADSAGQTPLSIASSNGYVKMAKLLLANCASIKAKDNKGQTPLYCASNNGHLKIAELLLDHGADMTPDNEEQTPAYVASAKGHVDIVRLLIESGADVTTTDDKGRTLLHASCSPGHLELTKLLLEMGADVNACNKQGISPLHLATENSHVAIVEHLMSKGADASIQSEDSWSLITAASSEGKTETVEFLTENRKIDAEKPDSNGPTPPIAACEAGHVHTARRLVNVNGTTPLQAAHSKGHEVFIEPLVDRGANTSVIEQTEVASKAAESSEILKPDSRIQSDAR